VADGEWKAAQKFHGRLFKECFDEFLNDFFAHRQNLAARAELRTA
jgi:hypothetical protein